MAKIIITNPDDLYTVQGDLITENNALELIGYKNVNDFTRYDRTIMKIDKALLTVTGEEMIELVNKYKAGI